ncbi:MAG: MBL fold metallo-hydrolase [Gammaproteobacteria bacterium]|nr:MBL fold metallo-hydrolase [Gammaproteobacteria bacterium]
MGARACGTHIVLLTLAITLTARADDASVLTLDPVLETSKGPLVPRARGYLVERLAGGAYWLTDGHYQMLFLTTGAGVIAVDAPRSLAPKLVEAIASVTDEPVTHVVYSHSHADHIGAAHVYPPGVTIIAHELTQRFLAQAQDPHRPLPTVIFSDRYTLTVGEQTLELIYPGPNHDADNILIWAPRPKILMMVDVVWPGWVHFQSIGVGDHLPGIIMATEQMLDYDFDYFVGGHANRYGARRDVELALAYLQDLRAAAGKAYELVDFTQYVERAGWDHRWEMFDGYFRELTRVCSDIVVPKWELRLGGARAFTPSNCLRTALGLWMD